MESLGQWIDRITGGASHRKVGERLDIHGGLVSRWVRENKIPASQAVAIARLYNADPVEALCVAGLITSEEIARGRTAGGVRAASTVELTYELHRRALIAEANDTAPGPEAYSPHVLPARPNAAAPASALSPSSANE